MNKNELLKRKNELLEEIEEINNKISKLEWEPKIEEDYYYITSLNSVMHGFFHDSFEDEKRINNLNYFQTQEKCNREIFEIILKRKLKKFANENNDKEINWDDNSQAKYCIEFDSCQGKLDYSVCYFTREFGQVYFSSKKVLEKAIKTFKDDLIRYFTTNK